MVAKRETLAKFMYDLTCDQESKQMLLTEADYSATCAVKEEITTLQPPCEEKTRAQLLNEWNTQNSDEEVDQGDSTNVNNHLEHGDGAAKESSNHTITAEGSDSSDDDSDYSDCGTSTQQKTEQVSSKDVCACTSGEGNSAREDGSGEDYADEAADKYNEIWNVSVGCRKKKTRSSVSTSSQRCY